MHPSLVVQDHTQNGVLSIGAVVCAPPQHTNIVTNVVTLRASGDVVRRAKRMDRKSRRAKRGHEYLSLRHSTFALLDSLRARHYSACGGEALLAQEKLRKMLRVFAYASPCFAFTPNIVEGLFCILNLWVHEL